MAAWMDISAKLKNMDYNSFASIYDLTCPGVEGDVQFFLEKSKEAKGGVLEVGCGTGRGRN